MQKRWYMFLAGFVIILLNFAFSMLLLGGDLWNFVDIPSLIVIFGSLTGVLTATRSFKVFYAGLRAVVFPKEDISEEMRGQAASLFRMLSKTVSAVTITAALICLINAFLNIPFVDAGGVASFGMSIATAMQVSIYGLLLSFAVFEPMVFILKKRQK